MQHMVLYWILLLKQQQKQQQQQKNSMVNKFKGVWAADGIMPQSQFPDFDSYTVIIFIENIY